MTSAMRPRETEIPLGCAPGWAEVAERVDRGERLRLVRDDGAPALRVMTEDDFDQAVEDAADMALAAEIEARMPPILTDPAELRRRHEAFMAFLAELEAKL